MNGKATNTLTLTQRAEAICAELGSEFSVKFNAQIGDPRSVYGVSTFTLTSPAFGEKASILLIMNEAKNRVTAVPSYGRTEEGHNIAIEHFVYPNNLPLGYPNQVGFMLTKKATQQAKDLCAQLIPALAAAGPLLDAELKSRFEQKVGALKVAEEIARALGYSEEWISNQCESTARFPIEINSKSGVNTATRFKIHVDGDVHVSIVRADLKAAKQIIKAMKLNG